LFLGLILNYIQPNEVNHNLWFVFVCGIVSVSGITIPGLSGSYILMLMGNYVYLLVDTVNEFGYILSEVFIGNLKVLEVHKNQESLVVLLIFILGSLVGLISFARLLTFVLKKHQHAVDALIIGFIIGSLGTVWPWKNKIYEAGVVVEFNKYIPDFYNIQNFISLMFILLGVVIVLGIDKYSNKQIN